MSDMITAERRHARLLVRRRRVKSSSALVVAVGAILGIGLWFGPTLLWAYNVERAGRLMDSGLIWPEPRALDSLPVSRSEQNLHQALDHLAAALRWKPESAHPYRLTGHIYAALQAWPQAAGALEQAQALEPGDTIVAWERALVYEQIWDRLRAAPGSSLISALEQAEVEAPSTPIDTPFCLDQQPRTCYVGRTIWSQPLAAMPQGTDVPADVIFLHPPAELHLTHTIRAEQSTLFFLLGLDPHARESGSDGANFQVLVRTSDGSTTMVYQAVLDSVMARSGWTPATADLAPWSGKTITLVLRTTAGPNHNNRADWYGWGNVTLLSAEQAQLAQLAPEARTRQAWALSRVDMSRFLGVADTLWDAQDIQAARRWYERALLLGAEPRASFRSVLASIVASQPPPQDPTAAGISVTPLSATTVISGEGLQWDNSAFLHEFPSGVPGIGVMWWPGVAVAVVSVDQAGYYTVSIRLQDMPPAPTQLHLEHNYVPQAEIELTRGDQSWRTFSSDIFLEPGLHVIGLRYLNDASVAGVDRNAIVAWLRVKRK